MKSFIPYRPQQWTGLTVDRIDTAVRERTDLVSRLLVIQWRALMLPVRYAMSPLQPQFSRRMFRIDRMGKSAAVQPLEGFPELRDSAWYGLHRIGYDVVREFRPRVVVELGTHMGLSALAMGLALRANGDGGQLYAVDTWQGEEHAGRYSDGVYETFLQRRDQLDLGSCITPLRMLFDEARDKVPTPIDLLHVDGLHTWEAVSHDWDTFGPLVRPGGIVMFHDVWSQWVDVRRFWKGMAARYPSYTIYHSNGLGLMQVP